MVAAIPGQIVFMDCTSLSISYDIMGIATVSYILVSDHKTVYSYIPGENSIAAGGQTFRGYISSINFNQIPDTNWYESHVTLVATTN